MMAELMIDAKDVTRNFTISRGMFRGKQQLKAVNGVDLTVERGEVLALVGESGCGKTTLAKVLLGLLPQTSGTVELCGQPINDVPRLALARTIQPIFQDPYSSLNPRKTIGSIIALPMKVQGIADQDSMRRRVEETMDLVGLPPRLYDAFPNQLSGGQRQRVAMGRALVRDPKLFLFDEPLSNLDAKLRVEMRTEIKKLHQSLGASMVYVTHDQIEAMTLATKIVVMRSGVVQQIGSPVEIYNRPANLFVADFMGSPAMNLIPAQVKKNSKGATFTIARDNAAPLVLHDENVASLPDNVVLGLRPEDIGDAALRKGSKLQISNCQVDVVEPAGADTYVLMALGGVEVTARLQAETTAQSGADMEFTFNMAKASYFDADTGERLN